MGYAEPLYLSPELDLVRNGLVSSISGIITNVGSDTSAVTVEGIPKLAMLNAMLEEDDQFWSKVKEFRRVMLLKTVVDWPAAVRDSGVSWVVLTEVLQLLRSLLPWGPTPGNVLEKCLQLLKDSLQVEDVESLSNFSRVWKRRGSVYHCNSPH